MNRNTLLAFILILATMAFFTSPTYQKINRKLSGQKESQKESQKEATEIKKEEIKKIKENIVDSTEEKVGFEKNSEKGTNNGDTIWIETEQIIAGISNIGAKIVSLKMKEYMIDHSRQENENSKINGRVDLLPENSSGGLGITINTKSFDELHFFLENESDTKKIRVASGEKRAISMCYKDSKTGDKLWKKFIFYGNGYKIGLDIEGNIVKSNRINLSWLAGINETEENKIGFYQSEERKAHYSDGRTVGHIKAKKVNPADYEDPPSGSHRWIGVASKYFFICLVADTIKDADLKVIAFEENGKTKKNGKKDKIKRINYSLHFLYTTQDKKAKFVLYAGPSKYNLLKSERLEFEQILFPVISWARYILFADKWFPPLAELVLWLLLVFYNVTRDYGIAIVLLTILSRVITYPLTQSSIKSMNRIKDIQPKINTLRQKYKSNAKKMNEEIMALYKAEGVNPLNPGCLPMFLQMPIFIALFIVLQRAIELRGASTVLIPWISDLSKPEMIFTIPGGGIPLYGANFAILPVVMAILTYFQNKMTIKDPNQKMMIYFMPIFMLVIFNGFPSGLVLYWTMSSAIGLIQQIYTDRKRKKGLSLIPQPPAPTQRKKKRTSNK